MRYALVGVLVLVVLAACGGDDDDSSTVTMESSVNASASAVTQSTTPIDTRTPLPANQQQGGQPPTVTAVATLPSIEPLVIEDDIVVTHNSYGLPGGTGYNAGVVFRISNPNATLAAYEVPYRVVIQSAGETIFTSDGSDDLTVAPGETRLVVFTISSGLPVNKMPDAATIQLYPTQLMFGAPEQMPNQDNWEISNTNAQCTGATVQCQIVGDITWNGDVPQQGVVMNVVVYGGDDASGTVIAAAHQNPESLVMEPGQTLPFSFSPVGFPQPEPEYAADLPDGPLYFEVYVDSYPSVQ